MPLSPYQQQCWAPQVLAAYTQCTLPSLPVTLLPVADRAAVTQLNYQLIAQDAQIHRSIAQRLITEMLQRLAMHIVAGHAVQVRSRCRCQAGAPQLVQALRSGHHEYHWRQGMQHARGLLGGMPARAVLRLSAATCPDAATPAGDLPWHW